MQTKQYKVIFEFRRSVLINPDGSCYLLNSTMDTEFIYGFASLNLYCQMYDGYLPLFMVYDFDFLLNSYYHCLSLPWYEIDTTSHDTE